MSRHPTTGWIYPSVSDLIITDAREGRTIKAICRERFCTAAYAEQILKRAVAFGFITGAEFAAAMKGTLTDPQEIVTHVDTVSA